MTTYTMTGPDGKDYSIDGPPGATQEQVRAQMQKAHSDLSPASGGTDLGVNSAVQRGFANAATFGAVKTDPTTSAAHPIATGVGQVIGGVMGGSAELRGITAGAKAIAPYVPAVVSRVVTAAGRALTLKGGQPVANAARLAGSGAAAGAAYGAAAGGVAGAQQDGASGVIPGAAAGAAENAVVGAVAGPVVAGAVKGVQAGAAAMAPASKRAIALLAKHLDMSADGVELMVMDHMAATGRPPTLADILNAKSVANLAPDVNAYQSSSAKMMAADKANQDLLPGRQVIDVVNAAGPAGTAAPFTGAPQIVAARSAALEELRDTQIRATMDPIRGDRVNLTPDEVDLMTGDVTRLMGIRGPARAHIATELDANHISIANLDVIRRNLNRLDLANPGQGYDDLANQVEQIGRSHPGYATALDEYASNSRFIDGFNHANAGKSAQDAQGAGQRAALQSNEGQAGLQVGARSRMMATAGASRNGAARTTDQLAQDTPTTANESLPPAEVQRLRRSAQAEQRSQGNYAGLSVSSLGPKANETTKSIKAAGEAVVATAAHAFPTTRWHAVSRLLLGNGIRESTANALTDILTSRDPAVFRTLPDALRAANVTREQQRVILNVAAKRGAAGAGAIFSSLTSG